MYLSRLLAGNAGLAEVNLLLADVAQGVLLRLHLLVDELGEAGPNILHQAWKNKRNIITSLELVSLCVLNKVFHTKYIISII
jgi:hypothetical protein